MVGEILRMCNLAEPGTALDRHRRTPTPPPDLHSALTWNRPECVPRSGKPRNRSIISESRSLPVLKSRIEFLDAKSRV